MATTVEHFEPSDVALDPPISLRCKMCNYTIVTLQADVMRRVVFLQIVCPRCEHRMEYPKEELRKIVSNHVSYQMEQQRILESIGVIIVYRDGVGYHKCVKCYEEGVLILHNDREYCSTCYSSIISAEWPDRFYDGEVPWKGGDTE